MPFPPPKPPWRPKHREERLKLLASGLQLLVVALFAGVAVAPLVNDALRVPLWGYAAAGAAAVALELLALALLRYIPPEAAATPSAPSRPAAEETDP